MPAHAGFAKNKDTTLFPPIVHAPSADECSGAAHSPSPEILVTTKFIHAHFASFLKFCGMGAVYASFLILTTQCTWTPEVKTPVYHSAQGRIILQTSSRLNVPSNHPHTFSESFMRQTLQGISRTQGFGILQELLVSSPPPVPVFSPDQISFLVPQLVKAFSQATSEELIVFQCTGDNEGASQVSGTVTAFAPSVFFLTLKNPDDYPGHPSTAPPSSRNLQKQTTLLFSQKQAVLPEKEASHFMKPSAKDSWIAINYATPLLQ